jgi:hypothetical protein
VSQLLVQGACEGLLLSFAPLKGGISHGLRGTGAAQVGFGGGCRALHPLIPELLNIYGQCRWAWGLDLWRGWFWDRRRFWRIGTRRRAGEQSKNNGQGSHARIEPGPFCTVKLISEH